MKRLSISFFLLIAFGFLYLNNNATANDVEPSAATHFVTINYDGNCGETNPKLNMQVVAGGSVKVDFILGPDCELQ
jgi:hypothetical protein